MGRLDKLRVFDPVLTGVAIDYKFPQNAGYALFPIVEATKRGMKITKFDKGAFVLHDSRRATGAKRDRVSYGTETVNLVLEDRSLSYAVDDRELEEATDPNKKKILLEKNGALRVMGQLGIQYENEMAKEAQKTSNYAVGNKLDLSTTNQWSDHTNSTPYDDIMDAKAAIRKKIGMEPNSLLLAYDVWMKLKANPKLTAKISNNDTQVLTLEKLREILEIDKIVIGTSHYTTKKDGDYTDMWTKTAILAYTPVNPLTLDDPSFGYTGRMSGYPKVEKYRDEDASSEIVAVDECQGSVITCADAGFLFSKAIA